MLFSSVVGHDSLKRKLRQRAQSGEIPHASLFLGPEGNGGMALALAFAQYIACEAPTEDDSCGTCATCRKFEGLQHADLHFTYPIFSQGTDHKNVSASFADAWRNFLLTNAYPTYKSWLETINAGTKNVQIYVAEAEVISRQLALRSYEGGFKFQIVWLPETMKSETANKLLKTIEEPPDKTVFIFVAESSDRMLPTVLSRTQIVKVDGVSDEDMIESLQKRHALSEDQALDLTHYAEGNYSKALALLSNNSEQKALLEIFKEWMRACYARDAKKLEQTVGDLAGSGRSAQQQFLAYALHFVRQCIVSNYGRQDLARFTSEESGFAAKFSPFIHHGNVLKITEFLNEASHDVSANLHGKILFMDLSLKIHHELHRKQ